MMDVDVITQDTVFCIGVLADVTYCLCNLYQSPERGFLGIGVVYPRMRR